MRSCSRKPIGNFVQSLNNTPKRGVENENRFEQVLTSPHFEDLQNEINRP